MRRGLGRGLRRGLRRGLGWGLPIVAALLLDGCGAGQPAVDPVTARVLPVTLTGGGKRHVIQAEMARTTAEQARGLMFRTDLGPDGGMLFAPYPASGGGPQVANFWMKDTPSPLDIVFVRADGSIARIAENTIPFSETPVSSDEPVAAVLEVKGGRMGELGIAEGDRAAWPGGPR